MRTAKIIRARSEGNQFIALQHTAPGMQCGVSGIAICGRMSRLSGVAIRILTYPHAKTGHGTFDFRTPGNNGPRLRRQDRTALEWIFSNPLAERAYGCLRE
jgi:hypothetical protein